MSCPAHYITPCTNELLSGYTESNHDRPTCHHSNQYEITATIAKILELSTKIVQQVLNEILASIIEYKKS